MLLLFPSFSVLVANPEKLLYTVANSARGLLNKEKIQSVDWLSLTNQLWQSVIGARNDREEQQNWSRQATAA